MINADYQSPAKSPEHSHQKVRNLLDPNNSPEMVKDTYENWAKNFEKDVSNISYTCPSMLTSYICSKVVMDKGAKLLDIGAGTGLLGIELRRAGYLHVDAVEPSPAMLEEATKRGVYQRQIIDFIGNNRLDIHDDTYDIVTGAGCFVPGHITGEAFEELCRILKPGGYFFMVCSERYYEEIHQGYGDQLDQRVADFIQRGIWTKISRDMIPYLDTYKAHVTVLKKNIG